MKKVTILGAGLIGKAMAEDLCKDFEVTSVDVDDGRLAKVSQNGLVTPLKMDLSIAGNG